MKTYKLFWKDGKVDEARGRSIAEAFSALGYGAGALPALDYYECIGSDGEGIRASAELIRSKQ